jgi:hypothetical protein
MNVKEIDQEAAAADLVQETVKKFNSHLEQSRFTSPLSAVFLTSSNTVFV